MGDRPRREADGSLDASVAGRVDWQVEDSGKVDVGGVGPVQIRSVLNECTK